MVVNPDCPTFPGVNNSPAGAHARTNPHAIRNTIEYKLLPGSHPPPRLHHRTGRDDAAIRDARKWPADLGHKGRGFGSNGRFFSPHPLARFVYSSSVGIAGHAGHCRVARIARHTQPFGTGDFCTSREAEKDVVDALAAGADDFIDQADPQKRTLGARDPPSAAAIHRNRKPVNLSTSGPYRFDLVACHFKGRGSPVELQNRENNALLLFPPCPIGVVPEKIIHELWGNVPLTGSRSLDTHAEHLRCKLELSSETGYAQVPTDVATVCRRDRLVYPWWLYLTTLP